MIRFIILPLFVLGLLFTNPVLSADFQRGLYAYSTGDYDRALIEFKPYAERGDARAQYYLGLLYGFGQGVIQDYKTAARWYALSAEQGDATAQYSLGVMYYQGQGVIQDYIRAHMWNNIAASNGEDYAIKNRDIFAESMTPTQIETAQKLAHECIKKDYKGCGE